MNFLKRLFGRKPEYWESDQMHEEKVWATVREKREEGFASFSFEEVIQYNPNLPSGWIVRAVKTPLW